MIFGYGIMLVLFSGGLTFFGYMTALIVGGEMAANICRWLYLEIQIIIKNNE